MSGRGWKLSDQAVEITPGTCLLSPMTPAECAAGESAGSQWQQALSCTADASTCGLSQALSTVPRLLTPGFIKEEVQKLSLLLQRVRVGLSPSCSLSYGWPECLLCLFFPGFWIVPGTQVAFKVASVSWNIQLPCQRTCWLFTVVYELPRAEDADGDRPVGWWLWPRCGPDSALPPLCCSWCLLRWSICQPNCLSPGVLAP